MQNSERVLVTLHHGYGLGDNVQVSVILQHLRKYRPEWRIDYCADADRHQIGRGIVENTCARGMGVADYPYDKEFKICLYDNWWGYTDRPNTHVAHSLKSTFGIDWDASCGRYKVDIDQDTINRVQWFLPMTKPVVALHTEGRTAKDRKNLSYEQYSRLRCMLDQIEVLTLNLGSLKGTPTELCALIGQCEAFVGIDSGPAKCASATETPTLVVWTKHHPLQFHDPAPNTTHLVPWYHHELLPEYSPHCIDWFEANYNIRTYRIDPIPEVQKWLEEVLK